MTLSVAWFKVVLRTCAAACLIAGLAISQPSRASQSTFQSYGSDQGLASLGGDCMIQDSAGYLLVCTEHGVFAYDGRRFTNLDAAQGLRIGSEVFDLAATPEGRIAVRYADEVFVSDGVSAASHSPTLLHFRSLQQDSAPFYQEAPHHLVSWRDGFVLLADDIIEKITVPQTGPARIEEVGYDPGERNQLKGGKAIFVLDGRLWVTFDHERICSADPGNVKCFVPADRPLGDRWLDLEDGHNGDVLARSFDSVARLNPKLGLWSVTQLPDQSGRYDNYRISLGLYRTPDGTLFTQADHGIALLTADGWRVLTIDEGAPSGAIVGSMVDGNGQLWFRILGAGLLRWVGYGHWETVPKTDRLLDGIPWQTARLPDGSLWVSMDTGVDQIVRSGLSLRGGRVLKGASFALASGPGGRLWRGSRQGVRIYDAASNTDQLIDLPPVNAITTGMDGRVWVATQEGLFKIDTISGVPGRPVLQGSPQSQVIGLISDQKGGVFYLSSGRLRHARADGSDIPVAGAWPRYAFEPFDLALGADGVMWIAGAGGLYRCTLQGDAMLRLAVVPSTDIRTNTVEAVMVDHRGWVWVGTALGASVFNGQRWVSLDADSGLISNDVDSGGMREDPDGSVWITTTQGVSHLLDPASIFADRPVQVMISGAELGTMPVTGARLPFSTEALSVRFGTSTFGLERSIRFRYQLSGVDSGMVESTTGLVRYAFVPPGPHTLTVVAYDELTHRASPPVTLAIDVEFPWWRQWWAELLWAGLMALAFIAIMRIRFRAIEASREELKRRIAEATEQLRFDRLTGLYIRSEIEERLAQKLLPSIVRNELVVALIDLDHFKRVNDTYGHLGGDDVLRAIGRLVLRDIWDGECAGRYGGEEILLILDDGDGRGAERVLNLLHTIRGTPFNAAGHSIRVTCSIGLAWAIAGDDWESLIGRADDALYEAKSAGRDRVAERRNGSMIPRSPTNERRAAQRSAWRPQVTRN